MKQQELNFKSVRNVLLLGNIWINLGLLLTIAVILGHIFDIQWLFMTFYDAGSSLQTLILLLLLFLSAKLSSTYTQSTASKVISYSVTIYVLISWIFGFTEAVDQWLWEVKYQLWDFGYDSSVDLGYNKMGSTTMIFIFSVSIIQALKSKCCAAIRSWLLFFTAFLPFNIGVAYAVGNTYIIDYMGFTTMLISGFLIWGLLFLQAHRPHMRYLVADPKLFKIFLLTVVSVLLLQIFGVVAVTMIDSIDSYPMHWPASIMAVSWVGLVFIILANYRVSLLSNENRKLARYAYKLATLDRLTQTKNRLGFYDIFEQRDHSNDAGVILCDIDDFKKVNDRYGHDVGDYVLVKFADALIRNSRDTDHIIRWGGEEFLIFTTNASVEGLKIYVEKLRNAIQELEFEDVPNLTITSSFGVTVLAPDETFDKVLIRADEKLYHAKRSGKNRAVDDTTSHKESFYNA